jgi:uncharacterized DUF497 family protein
MTVTIIQDKSKVVFFGGGGGGTNFRDFSNVYFIGIVHCPDSKNNVLQKRRQFICKSRAINIKYIYFIYVWVKYITITNALYCV